MKKQQVFYLLLFLSILSLPIYAQGEDPMSPSIQKIDQETLDERMKIRVSTEYEYYMETQQDTVPIVLKRTKEKPAKLHVKGRGSLNHVEIYQNIEDEYPILSRTFRGVHFELIDLKQLEDGEYQLRVVSNHRDTETKLTLTTVEE